MEIKEHDIHRLYAMRNKETEQVTGIFLYKDDEEAILHAEYAFRQHYLDDKKKSTAMDTEIVLVGEMDLKSGMTAGKHPKRIFSGKKFINKMDKEAKINENKE